MKQSVYQFFQQIKAKATWLWDANLSMFCISIIVILLSFGNASFAFLLPLSLAIDMLIFMFAIFICYKQSVSIMKKGFWELTDLDDIDAELKEQYLTEAQKFRMYQDGNRFGTKSISIYISKEKKTGGKAYSFFSDESIVLLHRDFDEEDDKDRITLLHEIGHCISHSLIEQKQIATILYSTIFSLTIVALSVIMHLWWMLLLGIVLWTLMAFCESKVSIKSKIEMEADAIALIIFEHLYGSEKMKEVAGIFSKMYCDEAIGTVQRTEYFYLLNVIWSISRLLNDSDRNDLMSNLYERLAIENGNLSTKEKVLMQRVKCVKRQVATAPKLESFANYIITDNPSSYYLVFPLLIWATWFTVNNVLPIVTIPWWCLFLCGIPILLIVLVKIKLHYSVMAKSVFIHNIINKQ